MRSRITTVVMLLFICINAMAGESQEDIYLKQILNQLEAIKPLIMSSSKEQANNTRIQFHYYAYRNLTGKHNGLFEDINEIERGIKAKLNEASIEPRHFEPIKGDYVK